MRSFRFWLLSTLLISGSSLGLVVACTQPAPVNNKLPVTDDDKEPGPKKREPPKKDDVPDGADPPLPDGGKPPGRIYAHTSNTLYRYDPLANTLVEVGVFDCVPQSGSGSGSNPGDDAAIDLALDRTGNMYATTYWRFLKVDATSGACQVIRQDTQANMYPNSLSFVPLGTVDPTQEALVGYAFDNLDDATIYTRINLTTGEMTDFENLNPTPPLGGVEYGISGDFISLVRTGGKTYAAVKQVTGDAGAGNDLLAEIDPSTGTLVKIIGDTGQKGFYGVGFWAGKAYGFTSSGNIYEIDTTTGATKVVLEAKDDDGNPIAWYGAGVTTDSPTAP